MSNQESLKSFSDNLNIEVKDEALELKQAVIKQNIAVMREEDTQFEV